MKLSAAAISKSSAAGIVNGFTNLPFSDRFEYFVSFTAKIAASTAFIAES
ncbi:MAG: hypothetical protein R3B45_17815 [Bdellovibrionota bacterium]